LGFANGPDVITLNYYTSRRILIIMKKDVNFTLFGIITLLLFSIVGVTIYYNLTYQRLNSDYQSAIDDVRKTKDELNRTAGEMLLKNEELIRKEKDLIDIINELNLSKQQVTSLGGYYTDLKGEKESIEANIDEIKGERDTWKSEYTSASVDLEYCERSYGAMQAKFRNVNTSLTRFQEMGDEIVGYANDGKGYVNDISNIKINSINNEIDALLRNIDAIEQACENGTIDEVENKLDDNANDIFHGIGDIKEIVVEIEKAFERIKDRAT